MGKVVRSWDRGHGEVAKSACSASMRIDHHRKGAGKIVRLRVSGRPL